MQAVFTMKMLLVSFVVVLLISGKSAVPVQSQDNIEASGETESVVNNDDIKVISDSVKKDELESELKKDELKSGLKEDELKSELKKDELSSTIEIPEEVKVETVKRSKKSEYPSAPCAPCGGYNAPDQYPQASVAYNFQTSAYGPPLNSDYSAPQGGYAQPPPIHHHRPHRYGGRKGYGRPSYQQPQPSYESPPINYQAPVYSAPSNYAAPQPSYNPPSYIAPSYSAPSYIAPSYSAPSYSAPSYTNQEYSAPAYPSAAQSYSYQSPAPSGPCTTNIVVGCHPHVQEVPCSGHSPSYAAPAYGSSPPQAQYRSDYHDESAVSSAQPPTVTTNELTPEKNSSPDNTPSKAKTTESKDTVSLPPSPNTDESDKNSAIGNPINDDNNQEKDSTDINNQKSKGVEEPKMRVQDTMDKMAELNRISNVKNPNLQSSLAAVVNDQQQHQQHFNVPQQNLPQNMHQIAHHNVPQNAQQNMSPPTTASFSGPPPPTSMNMNVGASNQVNSRYFQIPSQQWT